MRRKAIVFIMVLALLSFIWFFNKSHNIVNVDQIASTQSILQYGNKYIPDIISNLYAISTIYEEIGISSPMDHCYLESHMDLISKTAAFDAIINISSVYQNEQYLQLSVSIHSFLEFINDAQESKIKYIAENSKSFILIFENILTGIGESNQINSVCIPLIDIINSYYQGINESTIPKVTVE